MINSPDDSKTSGDADSPEREHISNSIPTNAPQSHPGSVGGLSVDPGSQFTPRSGTKSPAPLSMVETAFLASTSSLIWLINYYFPLGPVLRIFFPIPIALVYLRWGQRSAWMSALVAGLLLSVLMGPTRSILFVMPYGLLGVLLGWLWHKAATWGVSIWMGTLVGSFGFFFRVWLLSVLLGEDLWIYLTIQMTELADWIFLRLGLLVQPNLYLIQALAVLMVMLSNLIYLFAVHLTASLLLEKLGNPIPAPPNWVQALLDEE
jgi:uncharacterized protein YybS (DUF2232 family)